MPIWQRDEYLMLSSGTGNFSSFDQSKNVSKASDSAAVVVLYWRQIEIKNLSLQNDLCFVGRCAERVYNTCTVALGVI